MRLTSIQVTSHLHAGPENCISCPSRSNLKPIQVSLCVSYFHSCPASPASLSPLHAPFHIHPCPKILQFMLQPGHDVGMSHPSISCLTSIHVARIVSHLHHSTISPYPGRRLCVSTQSRSILNPIQVSEICVSSPSRLRHSRLLFILVESHLNPGPYICISPTPR